MRVTSWPRGRIGAADQAAPHWVALAIPATLLAVAAAILYWITGPHGPGGDEYIPLASAFLHGSLYVDARPWVELVPIHGTWAVPFPPAPALWYIPVVAITQPQSWDQELSVNVAPAVLGGGCVGLAYLLLRQRLNVNPGPAVWISAAFATTTLWWVAGMGGTHHMAEVSAVAFSLLALYLALDGRLPVLAGLLFALAVASRLPVGLSLPLYLYLYRGRWERFLLGAFPVAALVGWYNLARFGSPLDFGYARIPSGATGIVTDEPWYSHGLESPLYIPRGLWAIFMAGPSIDFGTFPYIKPNWMGESLVLTAPFLAWSVLARGGLALWAGISAVLVVLVDTMHGNPGFAQFGYRFILDAMPLLLILVALAQHERASGWFRAAVIGGAAFSAYGIWAINVMKFVS